MSSDDDALDILTPSAAMLPVLTGLRASLSRLGDIKTKSAPRVWDNIDFEGTACAMARFALCEDGWANGEIPPDDVDANNDLRHYLSTDLEIMSPVLTRINHFLYQTLLITHHIESRLAIDS